MQGHKKFIGKYSNLFGKKGSKDDVEDVEESQHDKHLAYWGWTITIDILAKGDRTKWDYFLDMNIVAFLNYLAFLKDKNKWQQ